MEDLGLSGRLTRVSGFDQELTSLIGRGFPCLLRHFLVAGPGFVIRGAKPAFGADPNPFGRHDLVKIQQMGAEVLVLSPPPSIEG